MWNRKKIIQINVYAKQKQTHIENKLAVIKVVGKGQIWGMGLTD